MCGAYPMYINLWQPCKTFVRNVAAVGTCLWLKIILEIAAEGTCLWFKIILEILEKHNLYHTCL